MAGLPEDERDGVRREMRMDGESSWILKRIFEI